MDWRTKKYNTRHKQEGRSRRSKDRRKDGLGLPFVDGVRLPVMRRCDSGVVGLRHPLGRTSHNKSHHVIPSPATAVRAPPHLYPSQKCWAHLFLFLFFFKEILIPRQKKSRRDACRQIRLFDGVALNRSGRPTAFSFCCLRRRF